MAELSHTRHIETVEFVDRHGKRRIGRKVVYVRSAETEKAMEDLRLGHFAADKLTTDPVALSLMNKQQLIITCHYTVARVMIATKLRQNKKPHKVLTGPEVLTYYLDRSEGGGSLSLMEGFTQFPQLFLLFDYNEAPNQYLSSLIAQLVGQRFHARNHVWLFIPKSLASVAAQWTQALLDLSYVEQVKLETLNDIEISQGPEATTPVRKPNFSEPGITPQRDITKDNKFRGSKDKR